MIKYNSRVYTILLRLYCCCFGASSAAFGCSASAAFASAASAAFASAAAASAAAASAFALVLQRRPGQLQHGGPRLH